MYLGPGPSTKGPTSAPRIVRITVREPKEEADDGGTSPRRKPTAYQNPGKATKRPSSPANSGTAVEWDVGSGSHSKASRKKATQPRPPRQRETVKCPLCGSVCQGPKEHTKHHREVHTGRRFQCNFCPQKFTTSGNKKKHEHKNCHSHHSPAQVGRKMPHQNHKPGRGRELGGRYWNQWRGTRVRQPPGNDQRPEGKGGKIQG